jgi:hypothetical protein
MNADEEQARREALVWELVETPGKPVEKLMVALESGGVQDGIARALVESALQDLTGD